MKRTIVAPPAYSGTHVGIIMDGNGRWAAARGLPRTAGHRAGVRAARKIVEAATRASVSTVTLYAFSSDNWSRPTPEVGALMRLLRRSLLTESKRCLENGVRL
jgi:undecaprenyl diphosphate synthase